MAVAKSQSASGLVGSEFQVVRMVTSEKMLVAREHDSRYAVDSSLWCPSLRAAQRCETFVVN